MKKFITPFIFFVIFIALQCIWLKKDSTPFLWDEGTHYMMSIRASFFIEHPISIINYKENIRDYFNRIESKIRYAKIPLKILLYVPCMILALVYGGAAPIYPPFYYIVMGFIIRFLPSNVSTDIIVLSGDIVFGLVLTLGVFYLTYIETHDAILSGLSVGLVFSIPIIAGQSRVTMLDFPMTAVYIGSLALLYENSIRATNKKSIISGICLAVGSLLKQTFIIFISGPLVVMFFLFHKDKFRRSLFFRMIIIWVSLISPWYIVYGSRELITFIHHGISGGIEGDPVWTTLSGLLFYPVTFFSIQVLPIYTLLFIILLIPGLLGCEYIARRFFISTFVISYIFFTLLSNKDPRYTMALLVFIPFIIVVGINKLIRDISYKRMIASIIFCVLFLQMLDISFGVSRIKDKIFSTRFGIIHTYYRSGYAKPVNIGKIKLNLTPSEVLRYVPESRDATLVYLFDDPYIITPFLTNHFIELKKRRYLPPYQRIEFIPGFEELSAIEKSDFILLKDGGYQGPSFRQHQFYKVNNILNVVKPRFQVVMVWSAADGVVKLLKKR